MDEKESLRQLSADSIKIHSPDFDYDIDSGSNGPTDAEEEIPTEPDTACQPDLKSNQYQL